MQEKCVGRNRSESCSMQQLDRNFRKLRSKTEIEKCCFSPNLSVAKIMGVGNRWLNMSIYQGAAKSLALPGRKQATATKF